MWRLGFVVIVLGTAARAQDRSPQPVPHDVAPFYCDSAVANDCLDIYRAQARQRNKPKGGIGAEPCPEFTDPGEWRRCVIEKNSARRGR